MRVLALLCLVLVADLALGLDSAPPALAKAQAAAAKAAAGDVSSQKHTAAKNPLRVVQLDAYNQVLRLENALGKLEWVEGVKSFSGHGEGKAGAKFDPKVDPNAPETIALALNALVSNDALFQAVVKASKRAPLKLYNPISALLDNLQIDFPGSALASGLTKTFIGDKRTLLYSVFGKGGTAPSAADMEKHLPAFVKLFEGNKRPFNRKQKRSSSAFAELHAAVSKPGAAAGAASHSKHASGSAAAASGSSHNTLVIPRHGVWGKIFFSVFPPVDPSSGSHSSSGAGSGHSSHGSAPHKGGSAASSKRK